ncbi:MAG: zinc dependent phospholipase C family protein [Candidatus Calescibacterium sp.]|nr:zinc dependent phospholipase C family protein [Candidatus Calescibacterium sp.]
MSWGPGVHAMISSSLIGGDFLPFISKLITSFQKEFIWGSLMADMMIGKNLSNWKFHPHNWEFIFKIFENAKSDNIRSFMIGYMTHLSHDIVAHNFLVPEIALFSSLEKNNIVGEKNLVHFKIEVNAERLVPLDVWKKIKEVQDAKESRVCSEFLEENLQKGFLTPKVSGAIYRRTIKINAFKEFIKSKIAFRLNGNTADPHKAVLLKLTRGYVDMAYKLSENFLKKFNRSICLKMDPTGTEAISVSFSMVGAIREVKNRKGDVSVDKFFKALGQFQPSIFGNKTPVLETLKIS